MIGLKIVLFVGILLSLYAIYVERKASKNAEYKAVCDISENMSCGKAFTSEYGKTFGISNSILGLLFYIFVLVLVYLNYLNYVMYLGILSMFLTLYLAYVSYFRLKNLCLVCTGVYIVNILLLLFSIFRV
jgi:vitamin-K-epoxide reductase (warfarin-sensitive)